MNPRRMPITALLLALCLLAGQWAGWSHRVAHGPGDAAAIQAVAADHGDHGQHAPGSAECRLLDHALAQLDAGVPVVTLFIAHFDHALPIAVLPRSFCSAVHTAYLARAPPVAVASLQA